MGRRSIRLASTFAVYPTETKNGRGDWSCPIPSADLVYQPVELVSNGDWLLTCWHRVRSTAAMTALESPGRPAGIVRSAVA